jgi:hypothetical protein
MKYKDELLTKNMLFTISKEKFLMMIFLFNFQGKQFFINLFLFLGLCHASNMFRMAHTVFMYAHPKK